MYTISDVVEMGEAQELVLSAIKQLEFVWDDSFPQTMRIEDQFD